jgi:hypothetical protein
LAYRRVEPLADGFAHTFPYCLGHPLMDGFGEALAQSLAGAIEVESVRPTLRLDECRADLLSQPLAKLIPNSLLDRVVETIAYPFCHPFPQGFPDALAREIAELLQSAIASLRTNPATECLATTVYGPRRCLDRFVQPLNLVCLHRAHRVPSVCVFARERSVSPANSVLTQSRASAAAVTGAGDRRNTLQNLATRNRVKPAGRDQLGSA